MVLHWTATVPTRKIYKEKSYLRLFLLVKRTMASSPLPRQAGIARKSAQCCELLHTERYNMLKTIHFHYIFGK